MPIDKIKIRNFKSLNNIDINVNSDKYDLLCFLGKNGSGKSNFLNAVKYFFDVMENKSEIKCVIDNQNPYIQKMEIEMIFNFSGLLKKRVNKHILKYKATLNKYFNNNKQISIKLTQYKDGSISWFPNDKELIGIVKKFFPLYFINTRFMDILDWNYLWEIISDLSKTDLKISKEEFKRNFDDFLERSYGEKYIKSLEIIENKLEKEHFGINEYDFNNRCKAILMSRLGGKEFIQEGNKLDFYSDGLNSFNYLKMLIFLIPHLAEMGWKNPIILIDEIEIGLHPQFIGQLVNAIEEFSSNANLFISTHSPILISDLLKKRINASIFRVSNETIYTTIERMNQLIEPKYSSILTMNETNCYFADALVFVEGTSEMQLLRNEGIKKLFPKIEYVDIYPYNSNNTKLKFIHPEILKFNIPYLLIVDMDKIINYRGNNTFKFKSDEVVNPFSNKVVEKSEKMMFFSKKSNAYKKLKSYNARQYITKTLKNSQFYLKVDKYYFDDILFSKMNNLIKSYCLEYNVLPVKTTIEGVIISEYNIIKVIDWIKTTSIDMSLLNNLLERDKKWSVEEDFKYRALIVRLLFRGKMDSLKTLKETPPEILDKNVKSDIKKLQNSIGNKTDGWIIDFMDYYFEKYIFNENDFLKRKEIFKNDFPELNYILQYIESMIY